MLKRVIVCLCAIVISISSIDVSVLAQEVSTEETGSSEQGTEQNDPLEEPSTEDATESTEQPEESTEEPTEEESEQPEESTEESTEEESGQPEESTEEESGQPEESTEEATEDAELARELDGDPQSGTSMSNSEYEPEHPELYSIFQNSSYTGLTYLHNSRFDTGYTIVNGIDVSSHNGVIDWGAVKAAGIEYAIIRAGYRTLQSGTLGEDTRFRANIQGALNAGLKVGVYIFSQAITQEEAVEEANYVMSLISGYHVTLPVVMDYEYGANHTGRLADARLDIDTQTAICNAFGKTVENAGYTPMIYANKSMLQSDIRGDVLDDYYKIWLANYNTETTYGGEYYAWQYSSKGRISGINGYVDCNFFYEKAHRYDLKAAQAYVQRLYRILLEREASPSEIDTHAYGIARGNVSTADVVLAFIGSEEYVNKKYSDNTYVQKLFQALLQRDAAASEVEYWTTRVHNGVSWVHVLRQIIASGEYQRICAYSNLPQGSITVTENRDKNYEATAYVTRCYREFLGREPEVEGLNTWTGSLANGASGAEIVANMVMSNEFNRKGYNDSQVVKTIYKGMLGRTVDADGMSYWTDILEQGVSYAYVVNGFANSNEFKKMCASYGITAGNISLTEYRDKNIGVAGFSTRCYEVVLAREGETDGVNYWCKNILEKAFTPEEVMRRFVFSDESVGMKRSDSQYIEMLYKACMDRPAETAGKQYWMDKIASGMSREDVFQGFVNSPEFKEIVAGYGL